MTAVPNNSSKTVLEKAQEVLVKVTGRDCYRDGIMFQSEDDKKALDWLLETLRTLINNKRGNEHKAAQFLSLFNRILEHGYLDHILMHKNKELAETYGKLEAENGELKQKLVKSEDDNQKLRDTIGHLTDKLTETPVVTC